MAELCRCCGTEKDGMAHVCEKCWGHHVKARMNADTLRTLKWCQDVIEAEHGGTSKYAANRLLLAELIHGGR